MKGKEEKEKFWLSLIMILAYGVLALSLAQMKDVPPGHWAREAVEYLVQRGYLMGYPDGTFRGDKPLTRYELAVALYRAVTTQPQVLWDEEALSRLRPLLRELAEEMREVDKRANPKGEESSSRLREELDELAGRLDRLEAQLFPLLQSPPKEEEGMAIADLVLQVAVLRDRLEMLEKGEIPQGLSARILNSLKDVYEKRLSTLEGRLTTLQTQVSSLAAALEAERKERQAQVQDLTKQVEAVKESLTKETKRLDQERVETHLFSYASYIMSTPPSAPSPPQGLYILGGVLYYDPKRKEGYEVLAGRTPGDTLFGFGYSKGTEREGFGLRGLFSPSGAYGFSAQGWSYSEETILRGTLAFRNLAMPGVIFPGYSGASLSLSGKGLGLRYALSGHALITSPSDAPKESLASQANPCARTAYGVQASLSLPLAGFILEAKGGYGQENQQASSCSIATLNYTTYEVGVRHDPTSPQALVPNLELTGFYGGHDSSLNGTAFGLSYWGFKGSYALELGPLGLMAGGFYRSFTPSGNHTLPPATLPLGIYPGGAGYLWGGDLLGRLGLGGFVLQVEAGYRRGFSGSNQGANLSLTPSLQFQGEEFSLKGAYLWSIGVNWDPDLPNPWAATGYHQRNAFSLEASYQNIRLLGLYDLRGFGRFEASYRFSW